MSEIDFETYKKSFGSKDKVGDYHVSISPDIYEMLKQEERFGIAFKNEVFLALMEDVLIGINTAMQNGDKDNELKAWKKIGEVIKKVFVKYKDNDNCLNDRYYDISASPDERTFFSDNPITKGDITLKISQAISGLGMFYRAMSTEVGEAVCKAIVAEKKKTVEAMYEAKKKNGSPCCYNILETVIGNWSRRIALYESYSKKLKLTNRSINYARTR